MSSSVHIDNTTYTEEALYAINFTKPNKSFVSTLHCNGSNRLLFVNATKLYQLKAKDSEIKS